MKTTKGSISQAAELIRQHVILSKIRCGFPSFTPWERINESDLDGINQPEAERSLLLETIKFLNKLDPVERIYMNFFLLHNDVVHAQIKFGIPETSAKKYKCSLNKKMVRALSRASDKIEVFCL